MKYAGPLGVTPRNLSELSDYCNSADRKPSNILFYYWGQTGSYMLAVRETALADQDRFPIPFRNLDWRDTPYPGRQVEHVIPDEFIEQVTVIASADAVTEPFGPVEPAGGTIEPEPIRVTDLETPVVDGEHDGQADLQSDA